MIADRLIEFQAGKADNLASPPVRWFGEAQQVVFHETH